MEKKPEKSIEEFRLDITDMSIKMIRECRENMGREPAFVLGVLMAGCLESASSDILKEIGAKDMVVNKPIKEIKEVDISEAFDIIQTISKTDEHSATKCFETINRIKDKYGEQTGNKES